MKRRLPVAVAIATGVLMLVGLLLSPLLGLDALLAYPLRWAALLGALTLLVGLVNLLRIHGDRVLTMGRGAANSGALLAGAGVVVLLYVPVLLIRLLTGVPQIAERIAGGDVAAQLTAVGELLAYGIQFVVEYVQVPIEATVGALLVFVLLVAGARLMTRRKGDVRAAVFLGMAVALIACSLFTPGMYGWVTNVLALGGARGILLGMALGAIATGLRVILGADRPYAD